MGTKIATPLPWVRFVVATFSAVRRGSLRQTVSRAGLICGAFQRREGADSPPFEHLSLEERPGEWKFFTASEAATLGAIADRRITLGEADA